MDDRFLETYRYRNPPYAHQKAYLQRFWERPVAALFADMGTGKSYMLINNIAMLYDVGHINAAVIVAPKGVYRNWVQIEIPKHMPDHVIYRLAIWSPSPKKAEKQALDALFDCTEDLKIFVINVEALSTKRGTDFTRKFLSCHNPLLAVDESTTIKSPTAQRAKNIAKIGKNADYRRIMTGSPITRNPLDLFQQCYFLHPSCLDVDSYYAFQNRYAVIVERTLGSHSFRQVVGYRRLDELTQKLANFSFRVTKEECLDLPEKVFVRRDVELTDEQWDAYRQMTNLALAQLSKGVATTVNVLTQMMRLHQIVCGFIKLDNGEIQELPSHRINELLSVVEEASGKIIIWATYRHDIEKIQLALQKLYGMDSVGTYYGDTHVDMRQEVIERFQNPDDKMRFFIGNPATGGYGITLTAANTVIYYSNSFDLEKRLQSEDRAHRIGQKKNVTYVDLIAHDTIDEKIVKALRDKIDIATQVLGEEAKQWLI
jgi:SNF2 family DNA or RNA helicase